MWSCRQLPIILSTAKVGNVDELQVTNEVYEENQRVIAELSNYIRQLHYTNRMDIDVFLIYPNEQQIVVEHSKVHIY